MHLALKPEIVQIRSVVQETVYLCGVLPLHFLLHDLAFMQIIISLSRSMQS